MKKTKVVPSTITVLLLVAACESTPQRLNQTAYNLTSTQASSIGTSSANVSNFSVKAAPSGSPKDNLNIPQRPPEERPNIEPDKPLSPLASGKLVADFDDTPETPSNP